MPRDNADIWDWMALKLWPGISRKNREWPTVEFSERLKRGSPWWKILVTHFGPTLLVGIVRKALSFFSAAVLAS